MRTFSNFQMCPCLHHQGSSFHLLLLAKPVFGISQSGITYIHLWTWIIWSVHTILDVHMHDSFHQTLDTEGGSSVLWNSPWLSEAHVASTIWTVGSWLSHFQHTFIFIPWKIKREICICTSLHSSTFGYAHYKHFKVIKVNCNEKFTHSTFSNLKVFILKPFVWNIPTHVLKVHKLFSTALFFFLEHSPVIHIYPCPFSEQRNGKDEEKKVKGPHRKRW